VRAQDVVHVVRKYHIEGRSTCERQAALTSMRIQNEMPAWALGHFDFASSVISETRIFRCTHASRTLTSDPFS